MNAQSFFSRVTGKESAKGEMSLLDEFYSFSFNDLFAMIIVKALFLLVRKGEAMRNFSAD